MPTVPTYVDSQNPVALRPAFQQGVDVRADASAFGADIGRGMQNLAGGVDNLGDSLTKVKELDDVNRAKDADNKYADWARDRMYGDGGYMTLEGRNAVDGRANFEKDAAQKRQEFGQDLTPGAAQHYQQASQARMSGMLQQSIQYSAQQRKAWFTDTSNTRLDTFSNDALANYTDPKQVNKNIAGGLNEIDQQGNMHGWDAEAIQLRKSQYVSGISKNIVLQMAQTDPLAADKYINDAGDRLSPTDRYDLRQKLKVPILAAKANKNVSDITGGLATPTYDDDGNETLEPTAAAAAAGGTAKGVVPNSEPSDAGIVGPVADGRMRVQNGQLMWGGTGTTRRTGSPNEKIFNDAVSSVIGLNEHSNAGAISSFIKNSTGVSINPAVTPWCAAFVNAALGYAGVKGTDSLAARSFMHFGTATDNPRPGDIAVFGRGDDPSKGHVGFFQGYDKNGNILVLGGNQGKDGRVSVSSQSPDSLLGFRSAGVVDENTMRLPNYSPQGIGNMQQKLDAISDPQERAATAKALGSYYTSQKKAIDANREKAQSWAETQLMQNPTFDPMKMPLDIQSALGAKGMTTLIDYQEKVRTSGQPVTDDHVLYDLQTQYASDPDAFAKQDLFQYRAKLSNNDWAKVTGWRQDALKDQRTARDAGLDISSAFTQSRTQLESIGLIKEPSKMSDTDRKRVAQFQNTLADQLQEFKQANPTKKPTQTDVQGIINRLLLPIVIKTPGQFWDSNQNAFAFEAGTRPDNTTVVGAVKYEDIPIDLRRAVASSLERDLGRKPSQTEVEAKYYDYALNH
jgi:uncharacterized protein (TIGR02594 family)